MMNAVRRLSRSDTHAQKTRPTALPMATIPTMPAATLTVTLASSWNTAIPGDKRDAGAGVQEQDGPECPPLPRTQCLAEGEVCGTALRGKRCRRCPASGFQSFSGLRMKREASTPRTVYPIPRSAKV